MPNTKSSWGLMAVSVLNDLGEGVNTMSEANTIRQFPKFQNGDAPFRLSDNPVGFTLYDYWQWMGSDLVSNIQRGVLAEFIVAKALGAAEKYPRAPWESYDLQIDTDVSDFVTLEVKSAAYVQSWHRVDSKPSDIKFNLEPKARLTALYGKPARDADYYVFCVLGEPDVFPNPLDLGQWEFYVLPTDAINKEIPKQKTIGLRPLQNLVSRRGLYTANYDKLSEVIHEVIRRDPPKGEIIVGPADQSAS